MADSKRHSIQDRVIVLLEQLRAQGSVAKVTRAFEESLDIQEIADSEKPQLYVFFGESEEEAIGMYGGTGDDVQATMPVILTVQGTGNEIREQLADVARDARAKLIGDAALIALLLDIAPGGESPEDGLEGNQGQVDVRVDLMYTYNMITGG